MVAGLHGQVSSVNVLHADFLMDEAFKVTDHYLKYHPAPDYFVGCNNQISLGIIKACIRHNLIPQKMSRCSASMKSLMPIFTDSISRVFPMIFRKLPAGHQYGSAAGDGSQRPGEQGGCARSPQILNPRHPSACGCVGFVRPPRSHTGVCSRILPLPPCHRADDSADFANRDVSAAFRFAGYPAARFERRWFYSFRRRLHFAGTQCWQQYPASMPSH